MTSAKRLNFSKITQIAVFALITAVISTTVYAESSKSGTIISVRAAKNDVRVASKEAKLTEKLEDRIAKMASREAMLKERLQTFKDKRKAELTQRISDNLNKINQNQTQQMLKNLDNMSKILDKLEVIVKNNTAITSARLNIATTSAAVKEQALNDYTIQISSEFRVKVDAKAKRDQLHKDLQAVRKDVIDTKQSIMNVFRIARSDVKIKEGTKSATND